MSRNKGWAAFQGELGAYSHAAATKLLGESSLLKPCTSFKDVFESVRAGTVERAIIPIENTLHGSVHENYDYLLDYDVAIVGETGIRISHQLIAMPGITFREVRRVFSHPVALNQCKRFFAKHPRIEAVPFYDTAGSVKFLQQSGEKNAAAIASAIAAKTYGGAILQPDIEDSKENFTRFFLLAKQQADNPKAKGQWKTSVAFSTSNIPGALFKAMACLALRDLNLTKIESRPLRGCPWEYLFYVDFLGNYQEKVVQKALANLEECTQFLKLLGSYRPTL